MKLALRISGLAIVSISLFGSVSAAEYPSNLAMRWSNEFPTDRIVRHVSASEMDQLVHMHESQSRDREMVRNMLRSPVSFAKIVARSSFETVRSTKFVTKVSCRSFGVAVPPTDDELARRADIARRSAPVPQAPPFPGVCSTPYEGRHFLIVEGSPRKENIIEEAKSYDEGLLNRFEVLEISQDSSGAMKIVSAERQLLIDVVRQFVASSDR